MKLKEILENLLYEGFFGDEDVEISGLNTDSRSVSQGDLFFCYGGEKYDSHDFASEAVKAGAAALVCERAMQGLGVPQIVVKNGRNAVADIARIFYGYADKKLKIIAVTGTNGKTTTTYMLDSIYRAAGKQTAIVGTLGISYGGKFIAPELTTPDPIFLHRIFNDMVKCGVEYVFMEVSAHALYFDKVKGINFEVGIFTNCSQDHLDFFRDMREYAECKKKLFKDNRCKFSVVNSDDRVGQELLEAINGAVSYGIKNPADVFAININENIGGSSYVINAFDSLYDIRLFLPAMHNVYNSMGAATCACLCGINLETIAEGLKNLKSVSGRLERVGKYNGADIFVDFAHTPDGLEKSLKSLKKLCGGKLICLFGCGGNRDKTKRPIMGEIAAKNSDFCVVTSDNPRFEDPYDIICDIEKGMKNCGKRYVTVTERERAIEYAVRLLGEGDILLVAGKGGENYQEIMGIKHSYNDNTVIKKLIGG